MNSSIKKGKKLYREHGFRRLIQTVAFQILGKCFNVPSRKIAVFNGVAVRGTSLSSERDIFPNHEAELITAIRNNVQNGEKALVIGAGSGASTVVVAHQVGNDGTVIAYEGNKNSFARSKDTIHLNKVDNRVVVEHAIIEKPVYLLGEIGQPPTILAKDLHDCDALIMDCEGAEIPILQNIKIRPRLIIVEAHPLLNSPKEDVIKLLKKLGYEIVSADARGESLDVITALQKY